MGYKFQFVTLAGFHALNYSMFELARAVPRRGHDGLLARCSRPSSPPRSTATRATKHQREVGTGYFDEVMKVISTGSHRRPRWPARPKPRSSAQETMMEDIRDYRIEEENDERDEEREYEGAQREEVPFEIPRD